MSSKQQHHKRKALTLERFASAKAVRYDYKGKQQAAAEKAAKQQGILNKRLRKAKKAVAGKMQAAGLLRPSMPLPWEVEAEEEPAPHPKRQRGESEVDVRRALSRAGPAPDDSASDSDAIGAASSDSEAEEGGGERAERGKEEVEQASSDSGGGGTGEKGSHEEREEEEETTSAEGEEREPSEPPIIIVEEVSRGQARTRQGRQPSSYQQQQELFPQADIALPKGMGKKRGRAEEKGEEGKRPAHSRGQASGAGRKGQGKVTARKDKGGRAALEAQQKAMPAKAGAFSARQGERKEEGGTGVEAAIEGGEGGLPRPPLLRGKALQTERKRQERARLAAQGKFANSYDKAMALKAERDAAVAAQAEAARQRLLKLQAEEARRRDQSKVMRKRTQKGQPVMRYRVDKLLQKLQGAV